MDLSSVEDEVPSHEFIAAGETRCYFFPPKNNNNKKCSSKKKKKFDLKTNKIEDYQLPATWKYEQRINK